MSQTTAVQKYTGDTLTEDQFNELVQTMNVGVLTMTQRSSFLFHYAKSLGLDPTTKPFDLIPGQNGKLIIYANRACSDQLRKIHNLSIETRYKGYLRLGPGENDVDKSVYSVEVRVSNPQGRFEDHIGNVGIDGLVGESMANASMKAHTKASRRGTIAFCGLGMLDETEVGFAAAPATVEVYNSDTAPIPKPKLIDARPLPAAAPPAKV